MIRGELQEDMKSFSYIVSIIIKDEGVEKDFKSRIQKARQAFKGLKQASTSKVITERTMLRLFNTIGKFITILSNNVKGHQINDEKNPIFYIE